MNNLATNATTAFILIELGLQYLTNIVFVLLTFFKTMFS